MDAIKTLLDRYGIPDPAKGNVPDVFTNPDLQALYDKLIQQGSASLVEALKVGVFIEETDIDDLTAALLRPGAKTSRPSIATFCRVH